MKKYLFIVLAFLLTSGVNGFCADQWDKDEVKSATEINNKKGIENGSFTIKTIQFRK